MSASLCQLAGDWRGTVPEGGLMAEVKHDGFRCLWFRGLDGQPRLWTRNGMPIEGCNHIALTLSEFEEAAGLPLFIDGELVVDGTLAATKAWVERGWRTGGDAGVFHAFDILPHAEWKAGGSDQPLFERKGLLQRLAAEVAHEAATAWDWRPGSRGRGEGAIPVRVVEDQWCFDQADVLDFARRIWAADGEGAMIKDPLAPYQRRRSDAWRKVKPAGPWWRALRASAA